MPHGWFNMFKGVVGSYKVNAFLFQENIPHIHDHIFNVEFPEQLCFVKVIGPI
jgi:hypothetical protein